MSPLAAAAASAATGVLGTFVLVWLVSLWKKDASIVDVLWGPAFAIGAWMAHLRPIGGPAAFDPAPRQLLGLVLVTVWALRLALYIGWRNRGHGEDYRYAAMRERGGPGWPLRSLFTVFLLQGVLALLIGAPHTVLQGAGLQSASVSLDWRWTDAAAVLLFAVGFFFEAMGDFQLARFKADPANAGKVMDKGLWRYTRHPNYFGDAVLWWGFYLLALGAPGGAWTLPAPLLMTVLLLKVSGVALLEKTITERRPEYRTYVETTNAFVPGPPRRRT